MTDEAKREPVDNSHLDAGIAARDSGNAPPAKEEPVSAPPEADDDDGEAQNYPEGSATSDNGTDAQSKPKNRGVGKRIDELTAGMRSAERERDHWREMAMRGSQGQTAPEPKPTPVVAPNDAEPTLESCDFDPTEFQKKWYDWKRGQERAEEKARKDQEEKQQKYRTFAEKEAAFIAANPDYEQVAKAPHVPITPEVAELVLDAEDPPAVAYYLGKNIEEATAIAQMTPVNAARAIGRIEAKLSAPATHTQSPPQQAVTRAPPPVTTLSGSPQIKRDYEEMSQREYEEQRRKEREAKGLPNR